MTQGLHDRPPDGGTGRLPPQLDYLAPLPPIAARSLTVWQRVLLAAFILFPIGLLALFMLAAVMGS